jgi:hypothetical protein
MTATPVEETAPIKETDLDELGQQKLTTLDRLVHSVTWTMHIFRVLGKSMPGRGHGARLADHR